MDQHFFEPTYIGTKIYFGIIHLYTLYEIFDQQFVSAFIF